MYGWTGHEEAGTSAVGATGATGQPPCKSPTGNHRSSHLKGPEPFTPSSLWERACPHSLHSAPHGLKSTTRPQIHDTPSELASANKRAGSLTSTCLPVLSVCLSSGPKANGRSYPNTPTLAPSSSQASFANLCGFLIKSP